MHCRVLVLGGEGKSGAVTQILQSSIDSSWLKYRQTAAP